MTAEIVRQLLAACLLAMYILAMFSLRHRSLASAQFFALGLFALVVPMLGPFLVILNRPGGLPGRALPRKIQSIFEKSRR